MQSGPSTENLREFEAAIAKIRVSFRQTLCSYRGDLVCLLESILHGNGTEAEFGQIAGIAHKINGVAGTLQLPDLGATARHTERLIDDALAEGTKFTASTEILEAIGTLLTQINDTCDEEIVP